MSFPTANDARRNTAHLKTSAFEKEIDGIKRQIITSKQTRTEFVLSDEGYKMSGKIIQFLVEKGYKVTLKDDGGCQWDPIDPYLLICWD